MIAAAPGGIVGHPIQERAHHRRVPKRYIVPRAKMIILSREGYPMSARALSGVLAVLCARAEQARATAVELCGEAGSAIAVAQEARQISQEARATRWREVRLPGLRIAKVADAVPEPPIPPPA